MHFFCKLCIIVFVHICELRGNWTENYLETFSTFIELHMNLCGYMPLCASKHGLNSMQYYAEKPCCRPCSCDSNCRVSETCCLDYPLLGTKGPTVVENISETIDVVAPSNTFKLNSELHNNKQTEKVNTETCVSTSLVNTDLSHGYRRKNEAFLMASVCLFSYKSNLTFKAKCEQLDILKEGHIDSNIPVTSTESFKSYRNKYCLFCNEGEDTKYMVWTSMLTCVHNSVALNFIDRPRNMFRKIASKSLHDCNIVFKPPVGMATHVNKCAINDVSSCRRSLTASMNNTRTSEIYHEMCRMYNLPVYTIDTNALTKFKNVACFICSRTENVNNLCEAVHDHPSAYSLEINILDNDIRDQFDNTVSFLLNISVANEDLILCSIGFVHDTVSKTCRKILCPRHHYIYHGACIPVIKRVHGVFYSVTLEARPNVTISKNKTVVEMYESALALKLYDKINTSLHTITFGLRGKMKSRKLAYHFIVLRIESENKTYACALKHIADLLKSISSIIIHCNSIDIEVEIDLTRKLFTRSVNKVIEIDKLTQVTVVKQPQRALDDLKKFEISRAHLCHRIALNRSEIVILGKSEMKIVNTGKRVGGSYFEAGRKLGFLACINDAIWINTSVTKANRRENPPVDTFSPIILITMGIVFAVVLLAITCVRGVKYFKNKSDQ